MSWLERIKQIANTPIKIPLHGRDATTTSPATLYESLMMPLSQDGEAMHGIYANEFGETGIKVDIDAYERQKVGEVFDAAIETTIQQHIQYKKVEVYAIAPGQGIRMWGVKVVLGEFHEGVMDKSKTIETLARRALRSQGVSLSEIYWRYSPKIKTPHDAISDVLQDKKSYPCQMDQASAYAELASKDTSLGQLLAEGDHRFSEAIKVKDFEKTRPMMRQIA